MTNETLNKRTYEQLNTALTRSDYRIGNTDLEDLLGMLEDISNSVNRQDRDELQRELKERGIIN